MLECTGLCQSQVAKGNMALCAPAIDISSKLAALIQNGNAFHGRPLHSVLRNLIIEDLASGRPVSCEKLQTLTRLVSAASGDVPRPIKGVIYASLLWSFYKALHAPIHFE